MMTDPHAAAPGAAPKRSGSWHELSTRLHEILQRTEKAPGGYDLLLVKAPKTAFTSTFNGVYCLNTHLDSVLIDS